MDWWKIIENSKNKTLTRKCFYRWTDLFRERISIFSWIIEIREYGKERGASDLKASEHAYN
jgi:hypothetical protein